MAETVLLDEFRCACSRHRLAMAYAATQRSAAHGGQSCGFVEMSGGAGGRAGPEQVDAVTTGPAGLLVASAYATFGYRSEKKVAL